MEKAQQITEQLEKEVKAHSLNPFASKLMAPLRLFLVWMRLTNDRIQELEAQLEGALNGK
ncbi:hypothetical protein VISI1226_13738 [Vibrio sinaloensis DSM 21326]|uniref:Uncharacterized protein n=1 Tax=Vibrio sinaloensis DSM 21326 TaxID=945550 RepID=E8M8P3_PHOS4|nr:hypothetical protein [Vibrio sinaloensis]EGA69588.1 hypothetical protein VISI1226_13738 [Vibrio sinaloensis DSM 21326]